MPDETGTNQLQTAWREQPEENTTMNLDQVLNRRTRELDASTRSEIMMSIAAATVFGAVVAWRFAATNQRVALFAAAAAAAWVLLSVVRFRNRIWGGESPADALAVTGIDHYRKELERRRDHLKGAWVWHGPLLLACAVLAWVILRDAFAGRLLTALPLIALLALWTAYGLLRRRWQARELQREIDALSNPPAAIRD